MELDDEAHIVLIYWLWMTTRSWDDWAERFPADSHVPGWPRIGSYCDEHQPGRTATERG